jgi:hypothetical protein
MWGPVDMAAHAVLSPLRLMRRKNQESERQWSGFCMSKAGGRIESFACVNDADRHRAAKAPASTFYWRLPGSMLRQGFREIDKASATAHGGLQHKTGSELGGP